jgi:biopolymer transport protein ExbD
MKFHIEPEEDIIEINLPSMVDMTFLLLIYFIVTFQNIVQESELKVAIPVDSQVVQQQQVNAPEEVVIDVFPSGEILWNGQPTDTLDSDAMPELKGVLYDLKQAYPDQAVVIRGQRDSLHKRVVAVLNACSFAGIDNISFPSDASVFEE